jgi:hypothetical protein
MTAKEFFTQLKDKFFAAVLNAVGSTTFWMVIASVVMAAFKIIPWESVLLTTGIYGANRIGQNVSANIAAGVGK